MRKYDLAALDWQLSGYIPSSWSMGRTMELVLDVKPEIAPLPARIPASVQRLLLEAGEIADWNYGLDSRLAEWVENRDWMFSATLPADWRPAGKKISLHCAGLDGNGVILLGRKPIGEFNNSFTPSVFELPEGNGEDATLEIIFFPPPRHLGSPYYSSKIRDWKPRFNYVWDWIPRTVQIGVWGRVELEIADENQLGCPKLHVAENRIALTLPELAGNGRTSLRLDGRFLGEFSAEEMRRGVALDPGAVSRWAPISPRLYRLEAELYDAEGLLCDRIERRIGFRSLDFTMNPGAPAGAEAWLCRINKVPTFLFGINWTPIRPNFADLTKADYESRLLTYKRMGVNTIRIWGGGFAEHECLFDLCDELGLLLWLEFPLSSSGPDNVPPSDAPYIAGLCAIARSYIQRHRHRPSLFVYCGGNELQTNPDGGPGAGKPLDNTHPALGALNNVVRAEDPARRFLPTSSSGPRFMAKASEYGQGLHHDVHGPWTLPEDAQKYWTNDDALFRSEVGAPGASSPEMIRHYAGSFDPADISMENPYYRRFGWWLETAAFEKQFGRKPLSLEEYAHWSRERQADALELAVAAALRRFPAIGGIILWMGHDSFPCTLNTSLLEFDGSPKPAVKRLTKLLAAK